MANPTAELFVKVGADVKGLKTGLDSAENKVGGFANTIKKHHKAIGMAMTAMGTAILAAGALSVKAFASMGDEVQKMALRTGFSTEALSEFRHAAQLSGASLAGLEKASRTLSGAILDAGYGLATYTRAFEQIGLSYESLAKLSPEQQFIAVMQALAGVEDETVRAAIATDLFGRAGTQLLPMLVDGAEGLATMRQEAHDLGIVFDQEAANKAAAFNDAITKLKGAVTGITMEIGNLLVDALKPLIDDVTDIIKGLGDWADEHPGLSKAIIATTMAVGGLLAVLGPLVIIGPKVLGVFVAIKAFLLTKFIPVIWATVTALWAKVTALLAAMAATGVLIPAAIAAVAAIALLATGITLLVKNQKEQYESTNAVAEATDVLTESTQEATAVFDNEIYVLNKTTGAMELYVEATDKAIDKQRELLGLLGKLYPGGIPEAEWGKMAPLLERKPIGALGGYEPGTAGWYKALGIEGFQAGGVVTKPTMALVGEGGPEAIVPLDRMGGITINFTEPVFMEREESINKLADRIYRVIKREQRLSFGGAYSG